MQICNKLQQNIPQKAHRIRARRVRDLKQYLTSTEDQPLRLYNHQIKALTHCNLTLGPLERKLFLKGMQANQE